jgi:sulfite reductase (NADPH) flavoprotein alpha-component
MKPITILYGTETGNAEDCSEDLGRLLKIDGFECCVLDMEDYNAAELNSEHLLVIVTSTYGNGEPPSNADILLSHLRNEKPSLMGTPFAVCGLGDTSYPLFSQCGKDFDQLLEENGGNRVIDRVDCDYDFDESFAVFTDSLRQFVSSHPDDYLRIPEVVQEPNDETSAEQVSVKSKGRVWGLFSR